MMASWRGRLELSSPLLNGRSTRLSRRHSDGESIRSIAIDLGLNRASLRQLLMRRGIAIRPKSWVGKNTPQYRGSAQEGYVNDGGYRVIYVDGRKILEHRAIMETNLGRRRRAGEIVHHKNAEKLDNRYDNLELMSNAKHSRDHVTERWEHARRVGIKKPPRQRAPGEEEERVEPQCARRRTRPVESAKEPPAGTATAGEPLRLLGVAHGAGGGGGEATRVGTDGAGASLRAGSAIHASTGPTAGMCPSSLCAA